MEIKTSKYKELIRLYVDHLSKDEHFAKYDEIVRERNYDLFHTVFRSDSSDIFPIVTKEMEQDYRRELMFANMKRHGDHGQDFTAQIVDELYHLKIDKDWELIDRIENPHPPASRIDFKHKDILDYVSALPYARVYKYYNGRAINGDFREMKKAIIDLISLMSPELERPDKWLDNVIKHLTYFDAIERHQDEPQKMDRELSVIKGLKGYKNEKLKFYLDNYKTGRELLWPDENYLTSNKEQTIETKVKPLKIKKGRSDKMGGKYLSFRYEFENGDSLNRDDATQDHIDNYLYRNILNYEFLYKTLLFRINEIKSKTDEAPIASKRKEDQPMQEYVAPKTKSISKAKRKAYLINRDIEKMIDEKGTDSNAYSSDAKEFLTRYTGYGGLTEFEDVSGKGVLFEYYTPEPIIKKMWALAVKYGFKGGNCLEPAAGIGDFIRLAPRNVKTNWTAIEPNEYSFKIMKILFPKAEVRQQVFEQMFISRKNVSVKGKVQASYDLVIGNPPYGSLAGLSGGKYMNMGEKVYTKAKNYDEYFITRSLDVLKTDGLLAFIIGSSVAEGGIPFLDKGWTETKKAIADKGELLTAYRLPNGVFDRTDVLTDILIIKKK